MESLHFPFVLPPLPYPYDALLPYMDGCTLHFHHDKHLAAYVENLNRALAPYPAYHDWPLQKLCQDWSQLPEDVRTAVRNNAGGLYNHLLYFEGMSSPRFSQPSSALAAAAETSFGSWEALLKSLTDAAGAQFGSGYAFLVTDPSGTLQVVKMDNQDTPLPLFPLLALDVWEHAYYLQYQNRRSEYIAGWLRLADWEKISRRYEDFLQKQQSAPE